VYAFYARHRLVLWALVALIVGEIAAVIALVSTAIPGAQVISSPLPSNIHAGACVAIKMPNNFSSLWYTGVLYDQTRHPTNCI